jgi:hypothetical protein
VPDVTTEVLEPLSLGYGARELITVASPAAGANVTVKVSKGEAWRLLAVVATLVTDANAANRWLELDYQTDAGLVYCRNGGAPIVTASTTVNFCWKIDQGTSDFASSGSDLTPIIYPLADFLIPRGDAISLVLGNKQATDQLSAIRILVEELVEGPRGYPVGRHPR